MDKKGICFLRKDETSPSIKIDSEDAITKLNAS